MATYKAEIKTVPTGSSYTVTVQSGSYSTAKQEIEHLYNPIYIRNLREVSGGRSSSSDGPGFGGLMKLFAFMAALAYWQIVLPIVAAVVTIFFMWKMFNR